MISEHVYNEMLKAKRNADYLSMFDKSMEEAEAGGFITKPLLNWRNMKNNRGALKYAPNHCQSKEKLFLDHATYHFSNLIIHSEPGSPVNRCDS